MVPKVNWFEEDTRIVMVKNFEFVMTVLSLIEEENKRAIRSTIRGRNLETQDGEQWNQI
ncbi:hypothetical protein LEMLEM_LOCUS17160, partial [Lemmus lemmus]